MVTLDTTKHESISENTKLSEGLLARTLVAELLNGIQQLLIEDRNMLHAAVIAVLATILFIHIPIESRAWALLAEVTSEGADVEEANKRKEFADAVLEWSS